LGVFNVSIPAVDDILRSRGFDDYKWLNPREDIAVAMWVRFKCMYGCGSYGKCACCPPAVPPVSECREMLFEYRRAVILRFTYQSMTKEEKTEQAKRLLELEREIFLAGFRKAFLLSSQRACAFAQSCSAGGERLKCSDMAGARPSPEAMGIDVFQTARGVGYPIEVLKDHSETSNRYSFILIE
jgi:predicted metal-binding protein